MQYSRAFCVCVFVSDSCVQCGMDLLYVFYAVRALKLDVLIIGSPEGMEQRRKVEEIIRINEEIEKANEEERKRILEEDKKEKDDSDEEH